jgi:hypothetical protein
MKNILMLLEQLHAFYNKSGHASITTLRRVHVTIVAVEKQ